MGRQGSTAGGAHGLAALGTEEGTLKLLPDEKRGSGRAQPELNHESSAHNLNEPTLQVEKARQYCLASMGKVDMAYF